MGVKSHSGSHKRRSGGMVDTNALGAFTLECVGSSPTFGTISIFSSAGSERLPYKQDVGGSNPSRCTNNQF